MFLCLMTACGGASTAGKPVDNEEIVFGDEQFEEYLPLLEGKRVALFTNQTGIVGDKVVEEGASDADVTDDANEAGTATAAVTSQVDTSLIPFGKDAEDNDIVYGQHILERWSGGECRSRRYFARSTVSEGLRTPEPKWKMTWMKRRASPLSRFMEAGSAGLTLRTWTVSTFSLWTYRKWDFGITPTTSLCTDSWTPALQQTKRC